jgi:hypothetical protein
VAIYGGWWCFFGKQVPWWWWGEGGELVGVGGGGVCSWVKTLSRFCAGVAMAVAAVGVDLRGGIPVIEHWRHTGSLVSYSFFWASSLELDIGKRDQQKARCLC